MLRGIRIRRFPSICELAKQAAVSRRIVVEIEAGRITPRFTTMRKLAEALGVPPESVTEFAQAVEVEIKKQSADEQASQ